MKAEALSRKPGHVGAIAFSRTGDPATGNFGDAIVIRKFGDVPEDLSALPHARPAPRPGARDPDVAAGGHVDGIRRASAIANAGEG